MIEANHLPDATTVVSLAILQSSAGVIQIPIILGPKVRVVATRAVAIKCSYSYGHGNRQA